MALLRPGRIVAAVIAAVNLVAVGGWLATRITGISWIGGLETSEAPHEFHADKALGDAPEGAAAAGMTASATRRWVGQRPALALIGVLAMSLVLAALLLPASPLSVLPAAAPAPVLAAETAAKAARPTPRKPPPGCAPLRGA